MYIFLIISFFYITQGYGDISPNTNLEILACVIQILVGCVLYAYVISKMGTILTTIAAENNQKNEILS